MKVIIFAIFVSFVAGRQFRRLDYDCPNIGKRYFGRLSYYGDNMYSSDSEGDAIVGNWQACARHCHYLHTTYKDTLDSGSLCRYWTWEKIDGCYACRQCFLFSSLFAERRYGEETLRDPSLDEHVEAISGTFNCFEQGRQGGLTSLSTVTGWS